MKRRWGILLFFAVIMAVLIGRNFAAKSFMMQHHREDALVGNQSFTYEFQVPNFSFRTLAIDQVNTSCGCTLVETLPEAIGPFGVLKVPVKYDLVGKSRGFDSTVFVAFGNGTTANLRFSTEVFAPLPETIELGNVLAGTEAKKEYVIDSELAHAFAGSTGSTSVDVSTRKIENFSLIQLSLKAPDTAGQFSFPIFSYESKSGRQSCSVSGTVREEVEADRTLITLGYLKSDAVNESVASVKFESPYGMEFSWDENETRKTESVMLEQSTSIAKTINVRLQTDGRKGVVKESVEFAFRVATDSGNKTVLVPVELYCFVL